MVRGVEDVLEALAGEIVVPRPRRTPPPGKCGPTRPSAPAPLDTLALHRQILDRLGAAPVAEDQLLRDLALPAASVAPAPPVPTDRRVQRQSGGMLAKV